MNRQEAYNQIREYFSRPDAVLARNSKGVCFYRIVIDGRTCKCAFGCLIPDDRYDPSFEGTASSALLEFGEVLSDLVDSREMVNFIQEAQVLHDHSSTLNAQDFVSKLDGYASLVGLERG